MASTNPFFDFDFTKFIDPSKFSDLTKAFGDYKVPGIDVESFIASQRKNFEAVTAANQLAVEGVQAVLRRQAEILRQGLEESSSLVSDFLSNGTPEDKVAKQAEAVKTAFEKALSNIKELTEIVAKSNSEAADVISNRVKEGIEEVKVAVTKIQAKH